MTFSPEDLHAIGQAVAKLEERRMSKADELYRLEKRGRIKDIHRVDALREEIKRLDIKIEKAMDVLEAG